MSVSHSVRRKNQILQSTAYKAAVYSPHLIGHAIDYKLTCSGCSPTGSKATCGYSDGCLQRLWQSPASAAFPNTAMRSLLKAGVGPIPTLIRPGGLFRDWIHVDDTSYYVSSDPSQEETWYHTYNRVQSQLNLLCGTSGTVTCTAPYGQPALQLSNLQLTICTGTVALVITQNPPTTTTSPPDPNPHESAQLRAPGRAGCTPAALRTRLGLWQAPALQSLVQLHGPRLLLRPLAVRVGQPHDQFGL